MSQKKYGRRYFTISFTSRRHSKQLSLFLQKVMNQSVSLCVLEFVPGTAANRSVSYQFGFSTMLRSFALFVLSFGALVLKSLIRECPGVAEEI